MSEDLRKDEATAMIGQDDNIHVELTYSHLNPMDSINRVKSPKAGAVVLFAGTTRDSFADLPVKSLTYQSYTPLALRSLLSIARSVKEKHGLTAISLTHRLGTVPIGEESILVAASAPHRQAGWRGAEEALELCKEKAEIWKLEEFEGDEEAVWRANRDGQMGVRVPKDELESGKGEKGEKGEGSADGAGANSKTQAQE